MKLKNKRWITVGILLIAFAFVGAYISFAENPPGSSEMPKHRSGSSNAIETIDQKMDSTPPAKQAPYIETQPLPIATPENEAVQGNTPSEPMPTTPSDSEIDWSITIETTAKKQTHKVKPDVDESTLRYHLGHLPSSSLPGQEGICVVMGHRDTQFSILQYCEMDDQININLENSLLIYEVCSIEIIESDCALRFDVSNRASLALVTCYPFHYSGHAPQKIIVYARLQK